MGGERRASALPRRVLALVVSSGRARGARISGRRARRGVMCAVRGAARSRPAGSEVTVTAGSGGFRAGEPAPRSSPRAFMPTARGTSGASALPVIRSPARGRPAACRCVCCCHRPCAASRSCARSSARCPRAERLDHFAPPISSRPEGEPAGRRWVDRAACRPGATVRAALADRALGAADRRRAGGREISASFGQPRMNRWGRRPSVNRRR